MGGIYTLGVSPGSLLRGNRIHDISSFAYGGWGIYFDEGTTGMVARDNVVFRTKSAGFHQHYGRDNLVENNIFAFGRDAQIMRTRAEEHLSFTFRRNIVLWKDAPLLGSNWQGDNYVFDNNTYWDLSGKQPAFAGSTFDQWQARGKDQHSVIADPCLTDPGRDDYRLQPSSPALGLGFVPFDQSTSGPSKPIRLPSLAPPAFPVHPGPAPPRPIAEDFENTPEGARASDARTNEENELAVIRVSAERALSGNRSLKFTDAPGQQHNYSPHLYWEPGFVSGVLEARFAILLETPVQAYHEWRTAGTPYRVGPSIWIHEDARLEANTRHLRTLPLGKWIRFRIVCGVGTEATGTYDLDVTVEGEPVRRWNSVKCDPEFRGLDWFGFTSNSELHSVFYLDDVSLKLRG